jgi:hypothetical protein
MEVMCTTIQDTTMIPAKSRPQTLSRAPIEVPALEETILYDPYSPSWPLADMG